MSTPVRTALVTLSCLAVSAVWGQEGPTFSGTVAEWNQGRGTLVMHSPRMGQPPSELSADQTQLGSIGEDGSFSFTLPASMPEDQLYPAITEFCGDLTFTPEGALSYPLDVIVYDESDRLAGLLFAVSPGGGNGPTVPGYSVLMGYSPESLDAQGACPDSSRRVEEFYDVQTEPGWHLLVQRFEDHPEMDDWRRDVWRSEPMPDDAEWVILRPPF